MRGVRYSSQAAHYPSLCKNAVIHHVATILATSENVLFSGHNHLLIAGTDDPTLIITIIKVSGNPYLWLAGGYDLEIGYFQKWLAWWLPGEFAQYSYGIARNV